MKNNIKIKSWQIKGHGRGKRLGFPTINLRIPEKLDLADGIYAGYVIFNDKKYRGVLHFGPIPTFGEKDKSLEVFLIDKNGLAALTSIKHLIEVEIIRKLRGVMNFKNEEELKKQMIKDVAAAIILLTDE